MGDSDRLKLWENGSTYTRPAWQMRKLTSPKCLNCRIFLIGLENPAKLRFCSSPCTFSATIPINPFRHFLYKIHCFYSEHKPIAMAASSKAWICDRSLSGITGSNPAGVMEVSLLWALCVVGWSSLRRADHLSGGVLSSMKCLSVIVKHRQWGGPGWLRAVAPWKKIFT